MKPSSWPIACVVLAVGLTIGTTSAAAQAIDITTIADAWLAGDDAPVALVRSLPAAEVRTQATRALTAWGAGDETMPAYPTAPSQGMAPDRSLDARRQAVRRTQALAALAVQVLLDVRTNDEQATAWENVARGADTRLARVIEVHLPDPEDRRRLSRFRDWWFVGYLQFLHEARRRDFDAAVSRAPLDDADDDVRAEFHAIRGLRAEYLSRLAPTDNPVSTDVIGGEPVNTRTREQRAPWIRRWQGTADGLFAEAIRRDATHDEARLHWGRIALERGRPDEAVERLTPLVRLPCQDATCGLAALFTGEAHDQQGRLGDADRAYALASSVPSVRPQALVALMQLAVRRGESAGTALTRHLEAGPAASTTDTAWNAYLNGRRLEPGAALARLRASLVAPTRMGG